MSQVKALQVRGISVCDIDALLDIERRSEGAPHWSREDYLACLREVGDSAVRRVGLVAELDNALAGFAILRCLTVPGGTEVQLESIVVPGAFRGRGVGGSLLDSAIAAAKKHGAARLDLEVRESNRTAVRLYTRFGFTETGRRRGYYRSPEEDAVLMSLMF